MTMETPEGHSEAQKQPIVPQKTNGMCIAAFVLALGAILTAPFVIPGFLASILALVLGILGIKKAKREGHSGETLGMWGIVLSCLSLLVSLTLAGIATWFFLELKKSDEFKQEIQEQIEHQKGIDPEGAKKAEKIFHFLGLD
jgi:uncharacterized membrane protein